MKLGAKHILSMTHNGERRTLMRKLSNKKIEKIIKEYPDQTFDICSVCDGVELHNQMNEINEVDWDLICDECLGKEKSDE